MKAQRYYPVYANLTGRACLVVGGGLIAQRKVTTLLEHGAVVTVVSPDLTSRLQAWAKAGKISLAKRRFRPADLREKWLVYAATDDQAVNEEVFAHAQRSRIFCNVVDQTRLCSFIAPAILKRGPLTIAISTGGRSPAMAKELRGRLGRAIGPEYLRMLRLIRAVRPQAKRRLATYGDRKRYFDVLLKGKVFALVRSGHEKKAMQEAQRLMDKAAVAGKVKT